MTRLLPRSATTRGDRAAARDTVRLTLRIFGAVLAGVAVASVAVAYWAGVFDRVTLEERTVGPCHLLYRQHRGPYENIRLTMRDVFVYYRKTFGVDPTVGFAIFHDTPGKVAPDSLRSDVGCITDSLMGSPEAPYLSRTVPAARAIVGSFRLRSYFSYMSGPMKFYPALERYQARTGPARAGTTGPVMEVYDMHARRILYVAFLQAPPPSPPADSSGNHDAKSPEKDTSAVGPKR